MERPWGLLRGSRDAGPSPVPLPDSHSKGTQKQPQDGTESKLIYKKKKRKEKRKFTEDIQQKKGAKTQRKRNNGALRTKGLAGGSRNWYRVWIVFACTPGVGGGAGGHWKSREHGQQ